MGQSRQRVHRHMMFSIHSSGVRKVYYRTVHTREKIAPYWISLLKVSERPSFKSTLYASEAMPWFSRGKNCNDASLS